jgi:hypothetical protein
MVFWLDANTGEVVQIPNILGDIIVENEFIHFFTCRDYYHL